MRNRSGRPPRGGRGFSRGFGRGYDGGGRGRGRARGRGGPDNPNMVELGKRGRGLGGGMHPTDPRDRARITGDHGHEFGAEKSAPSSGPGPGQYDERSWRGSDQSMAQGQGMDRRRMGHYPETGQMSSSGMPMPRSNDNYQNPPSQRPMDAMPMQMTVSMSTGTERSGFDTRSDGRSQQSYEYERQTRSSDHYNVPPERSRYPYDSYSSVGGGNQNEDAHYRREQEDYYRSSKGRMSSDGLERKSPSESSPEYFSTNYPTTELDEEFQRNRPFGNRHEREEHEDYGEDEFEFDEPEVKDGEGKPEAELSDIDISDEQRCSPKHEGDQRNPNQSLKESHSQREYEDHGYDEQERGVVSPRQRRHESPHDQNVARDSPSGSMDLERAKSRREDEESKSRHLQDGGSRSKEEEHSRRDSRSRSSSLQKDVPDTHQKSSEVSSEQRPSASQQQKGSKLPPQDPQLSLVITVTNDQCQNREQQDQPSSAKGAAERLGPPAKAPADRLGPPATDAADRLGPPATDAADRLGPPAKDAADRLGPPAKDAADRLGPPVKDAADRLGPPVKDVADRLGPPARDAAERLGPLSTTAASVATPTPILKSALKKSRKSFPVDDDFDLYADIPPPENEDVQTSTKNGKQEPTLGPKEALQAPSDRQTFPAAANISQQGSSVTQSTVPVGGTAFQESQQQTASDTSHPNPDGAEKVSIMTIPKSKWDSDEEDSDKHILLVPKTDPPKPEAPPAPKKRDPSLHVGQIVKDFRYNNPAKSKVQELIGESKSQEIDRSDDSSDDSYRRGSKSRKKRERSREKRSRSRDRKRDKRRDYRRDDRRSDSRHRERRRSRSYSRERDRRRSRSGSRDRGRDKYRMHSSYRGRYFNRGRARGRGRGYFYQNYDNRDQRYDSRDWKYHSRRRSRSRSWSRDRDRRRSRRDRYSSSRSRSRSSSYSDSFSSRSSSRSSYSSLSRSDVSRSRSRSRSKEKDRKKASELDKDKVKVATDDKKVNKSVLDEDKKVKDIDKSKGSENMEKEYDIFTGDNIPKHDETKTSEGGTKTAVESSFAKVGGLSDPLGLKQLAKPIALKNKVYSGPIHDMPPLTVKPSTEATVTPTQVPLASAKPLKSILKKKKTTEDVEDKPQHDPGSADTPSNLDSAGLAQLTSILGKLVPQGSQPISQSVASLVAALSTQQQQQQKTDVQHQEQQMLQQAQQIEQQQYQQHDSLGLLGRQSGNTIPGLGNEAGFASGHNVLSFLAGNPNASIPGLDTGISDQSAHHPSHRGGISTFSATGFGGLSSATVASGLPSSVPGLTDATNSSYESSAQQPQSNLDLSSLLQQSGLKMTPELSAALSGMQQQQQQQQSVYPTKTGLSDGSAGHQTSYHASSNETFLSATQMGQSSAVEEEDRFLYGEQSQAYQGQQQSSQTWQAQKTVYPPQQQVQVQHVSQEEYDPASRLPATQAQSVDSDQVQKILTAIGFDFDMAKKVAQEKEKGKAQQVAHTGSSKSDLESIQKYVKAQRAESAQKPSSQVTDAHGTGAPGTGTSAEYKLDGLNQTASFLVTGLQVPEENVSKETSSKAAKKKKKKDKSEKKKAKKEKLAQKEKQGKEADTYAKTKSSNSADKQISNKDEHTRKVHGELDKSKPYSQSGKGGLSSPLTEPISDDELQQEPAKKHSQYPDLANMKIQVAHQQSSSDYEPNRRIVLLPQEQEKSQGYGKEGYLAKEQTYGPQLPMSKEQPAGSWQMQQHYSKDDYYYQQDWEAKERRRIEEQLRKEFLQRENAEKEKRRKEMLKKEQEWLMREVALKTMEEKIRREEEKLLREKEAKKREEYRRQEADRLRDVERKWRVNRERESIQKNLNSLEKELASLKKQQGDLMRRKQHQKDGHKDPQLLKNNEMQDQICEEIRRWRKLYATAGDRPQERDEDRSKRESLDDRERRSRDQSSERPTRPSPGRDLAKEDAEERNKVQPSSFKHDKRSSIDENQEGKARFKFTYVDDGNHWCKPCQKAIPNLNELFLHLHSKKHMKHVDLMDRPWLTSDVKQEKTTDEENRLRAPIKGGEFIMPVNGFYCRLCNLFFGDAVCGCQHMKDPHHNIAYQNFVDENKQYEKQLELEKAASGLASHSDLSKAEVEEKKGIKRKAEEDDDDKEEKHAKKDMPDVKISTKQPGGFGVFEFDKPKDEKASAPATTLAPPLELRKDSGQKESEAAAKKEQQQKLSIKLGSKRLIPSALLKKPQAATTTVAAATTAAALMTTGSAAPRARAVRSSTLAQRPMPMIGKRPTRRSREELKEPPEQAESQPAQPSLEMFLQGSGGKALPVISDDKKEEKEKESSEFVLTAGEIASAFSGLIGSDAAEGMELQVIDACEDSDDGEGEIPAVPGSEGDSGDPSSLPKPVPPPPSD